MLDLHLALILHPAFQQILRNGQFRQGEELLPLNWILYQQSEQQRLGRLCCRMLPGEHETAVRSYDGAKADGVSGLCGAQMSNSYCFSVAL